MDKGKSSPTPFWSLDVGGTRGHSSTSTVKVNFAAKGGVALE